MSQTRQRAAFDYLLQQFAASAGQSAAQRWRYLEAAHVLGQNRLALHLRAHWQMLRFAQALGDQHEARGQLSHLCMAPVGHIVRRMPIVDGALPGNVCEDPEFDENGNPIGCKVDRVGWPAGYAEGNFDNWQASTGRVSGAPFPVNHFASQLRNNGADFYLQSGTSACDADPYSPECRQCYLGAAGCNQLNGDTDAPNLRCWNQKKRFGVDMLYPLKRYVDGLTQNKVYDRNGFLVPNPLFDDLPFKQSRKTGTPLNRAKAETRNSLLVFYANIVGVPWQDIARDPKDLTKGYKPAIATQEGETGIDWDLILGTPFEIDKARRKGPEDPLMEESVTQSR